MLKKIVFLLVAILLLVAVPVTSYATGKAMEAAFPPFEQIWPVVKGAVVAFFMAATGVVVTGQSDNFFESIYDSMSTQMQKDMKDWYQQKILLPAALGVAAFGMVGSAYQATVNSTVFQDFKNWVKLTFGIGVVTLAQEQEWLIGNIGSTSTNLELYDGGNINYTVPGAMTIQPVIGTMVQQVTSEIYVKMSMTYGDATYRIFQMELLNNNVAVSTTGAWFWTGAAQHFFWYLEPGTTHIHPGIYAYSTATHTYSCMISNSCDLTALAQTVTPVAGTLPYTGVLDIPADIDLPARGVVENPSVDVLPGEVAVSVPVTVGDTLTRPLEDTDTGTGDITFPTTPPALEQMKTPAALLDKFPFCIPFDIVFLFDTLAASREAPKYTLTIFGHAVVFDLAPFESLAAVSRACSLILFSLCLAVGTRKLIGA